jgi:hypothetical protein
MLFSVWTDAGLVHKCITTNFQLHALRAIRTLNEGQACFKRQPQLIVRGCYIRTLTTIFRLQKKKDLVSLKGFGAKTNGSKLPVVEQL